MIVSRWSGWCKACGESFQIDETVAWMKLRGCTHYECRDFWEEAEPVPF